MKANYLASPPLVVAYALAGTLNKDLTTEPLGNGSDGQPVYLKDIWPTSAEIAELIRTCVTPDMFAKRYGARVRGRREVAGHGQGQAEPHLPLELGLHLRAEPALFRGLEAKPGADPAT